MTTRNTLIMHMSKVMDDLDLNVKDIIADYNKTSSPEVYLRVCSFHYRVSKITFMYDHVAQADLLEMNQDAIWGRIDRGRRLKYKNAA